MSEMINNGEKRRDELKRLILELHEGVDFEIVKDQFKEKFSNVSAREISEMEQALIQDGLPVESIQKLCDVHAAVFNGSIEEIHNEDSFEDIPGHPVHDFLLENREIEKRVEYAKAAFLANDIPVLLKYLEILMDIDRHYSRKENLIFPLLENHGISGPPKVMWAIDDEVRNELKKLSSEIREGNQDIDVMPTLRKILEMVFKEDNILVPMVLDEFSEEEWVKVKDGSDEIGFCYIEVEAAWKPKGVINAEKADLPIAGSVNLGAGALTQIELRKMLNTLPVDITFVDSNDKVKYFSEGSERIFPRPRTIIGREVSNCHPPASVHVVEQLVADLKSGKKNSEDFWIRMGEKFVLIRYFAIRDDEGKYLGTLEFTQNIKAITELEGEKRLVT